MTKRYITLSRKYLEKSSFDKDKFSGESHFEKFKISPDNILYLSQEPEKVNYGRSHYYCTRIKTITGEEVLVRERIEDIEKIIEEFYTEQEKGNKDKIIISKSDIMKNFIFRNLGQ